MPNILSCPAADLAAAVHLATAESAARLSTVEESLATHPELSCPCSPKRSLWPTADGCRPERQCLVLLSHLRAARIRESNHCERDPHGFPVQSPIGRSH